MKPHRVAQFTTALLGRSSSAIPPAFAAAAAPSRVASAAFPASSSSPATIPPPITSAAPPQSPRPPFASASSCPWSCSSSSPHLLGSPISSRSQPSSHTTPGTRTGGARSADGKPVGPVPGAGPGELNGKSTVSSSTDQRSCTTRSVVSSRTQFSSPPFSSYSSSSFDLRSSTSSRSQSSLRTFSSSYWFSSSSSSAPSGANPGIGGSGCGSSSLWRGSNCAAIDEEGLSWVSRRGRGVRGEAMEEEEGRGGVRGRRKARVVIIGAGMAGIAAAQRLQRQLGAGRYELTILEASDRIGGRICSSELNGEGIELGATWIHGVEGSPLFAKASEIGAMENADRAWEGQDGLLDNEVLKAEGGLEVPKKLVEPVVELYKHMLLDVQEMGNVQPKEMVAGAGAAAVIDTSPVKFSDLCGDFSLGAFLRQGLDRFLAQQSCRNSPATTTNGVEDSGGRPRWTARSLEEGSFRMHENLERSITAADDLNDIDLIDFHEYWEFPGEHRTIGKGYSTVVRALARELPPGVVQFGHNVERIVWSDDSSSCPGTPVRIHCQGGSVVEADHVILTVSLGVLKASTSGGLESEAQANGGHSAFPPKTLEAEVERKMQLSGETGHTEGENGCAPSLTASSELFDPPLPTWKLDSICKLGFGVVDKVFVQVEPAGKGGQHRPLQFIFHPTAAGEKQQQSDATIPSWMRKTFSLYPIHKNSHVLLAWFAGQEAQQVESLTDEEIINGISKTLTGFGIPEDEQGAFLAIKRSKWGQNPLFRGSYSYVKVGSTGKDIDTLAEPLPRLGAGGKGAAAAPLQLLFAGEATHRHYYSTTHGAYFSGLREAERLLKHYGLLAH